MTEAVFGLIGVVVGAIVTGGFEWFFTRRRERASARTGARLIQLELQDRVQVIDQWVSIRRVEPLWWKPREQWSIQSPVLAATLNGPQWEAVSRAYQEFEDTDGWIAEVERVDNPERRAERFTLPEGTVLMRSISDRSDLARVAIASLEETAHPSRLKW
jgi:hypothetical protein